MSGADADSRRRRDASGPREPPPAAPTPERKVAGMQTCVWGLVPFSRDDYFSVIQRQSATRPADASLPEEAHKSTDPGNPPLLSPV